MKPDLQQKLYDKYPSLFAQKDLPMTQTCMCWGIDTGDGWYDLIDRTCAKIMEIDKDKVVQFEQVKEKWAELRIYTNGLPMDIADQVWDIIDKATEESYEICEACGSTKDVKQHAPMGWVSTKCDKCRAEEEAKAKEYRDKYKK